MDDSKFIIYCPRMKTYLLDFEPSSGRAGCWTGNRNLCKEFDFLPGAFRTAKELRDMGKAVQVHHVNKFGIRMKCKLDFDKKTNEAVTEFYGFSGQINQMNAELFEEEEEEKEERYKVKLILSEYASRELMFKKTSLGDAIKEAFKQASEDGRDIMRFELCTH